MKTGNYSEEKLNGILMESISEFRTLIKKQDGGSDTLPDPDKFRYLHEFKNHDLTKGGILVVGINPHIGNSKKDSKWRERYRIDERNTSDCLLTEYSYFKKFTAKSEYDDKKNEKYKMDLLSVNSNVKFTDIILIRSESKTTLKSMLSERSEEEDHNLYNAIELGWEKYLSRVMKLIRPDVMVCNSVDLSWFLEEKAELCSWEKQDDIINIRFGEFILPCVLSGQVTGQRATDKWALIRLRNSIINVIKN